MLFGKGVFGISPPDWLSIPQDEELRNKNDGMAMKEDDGKEQNVSWKEPSPGFHQTEKTTGTESTAWTEVGSGRVARFGGLNQTSLELPDWEGPCGLYRSR